LEILSHERVFSGLRASFVKRQAFKPLNRCALFKPFKPTSALRVQSSNTLYPEAVKSVLDFGFRPNHRSDLRNQFAMPPPFFALHLLYKIQIANGNCFRPPCVSDRQLISKSDLYPLAMSLLKVP
jgi:hypothetical protein